MKFLVRLEGYSKVSAVVEVEAETADEARFAAKSLDSKMVDWEILDGEEPAASGCKVKWADPR